MISESDLPPSLRDQLEELTRRAEDAEQMLRAIRAGEVDALVVGSGEAAQVYTLQGADHAYRVLLEGLSEGAVTLSENGTILYSNRRFASMVGVPHERVVGASFAGFVHTPDRHIFQDLLQQERSCRADLALGGPEGTLVLCVISMSPVAIDGVPTAWAVVATDVTLERRRAQDELSEQKDWFRGTLSSIGDAVIATDSESAVVFMNRVAAELTGWGTEGIGAPLKEVFHIINEETRARVEDPTARVLETGAFIGLANHTLLISRDGTECAIDDSAAPIRDARGNLLGVVLVFRDITKRKRAEEAIAQERERYLAQIEEANEAKDLFFNTLSHELRTPLAAMVSSVEVLKHPDSSQSQRSRSLGILERNVRHQTRLIEDLLDLSRIMRGKVEIEHDPLDLRDVVNAQIDAVEGAVHKARLALEVDAPPTPVPIQGDAVRLGQVLSNVLTNAIKFTSAGGAIQVQVASQDGEAVVRVRDTGAGIAPEVLPQIFEPFRQVETSLARSKGGLGIGLAVARSLAELHGGRLEARSPGLDKGSEFTLRIPLRPEGQTTQLRFAAAQIDEVSRRVLVIEDNPDLRESLVILLEMMGHHVVSASDGNAGIDLARRENPEVALIDIGLPDMDGYAVARLFRSDPALKDTRLIALTGYATPEHRERALSAGFNYHLAKPVDVEDLQRVLGVGVEWNWSQQR